MHYIKLTDHLKELLQAVLTRPVPLKELDPRVQF